jgi:hypothetical protein
VDGDVAGDPDLGPEELAAGFARGRADIADGLARISAAIATLSEVPRQTA